MTNALPRYSSSAPASALRGAATVEHLSAAAEQASDDPLVQHGLELEVSQTESPVAAVPHWKRTLALEPSHREAIYNLAQALKEVDAARSPKYRDRWAAPPPSGHPSRLGGW